MSAALELRGGAAALLALAQWLSPAFPVGGFAYSHGLEAEIAAGRVCSAATLERWLAGVLAHGAGRNDAILLLRALDPASDPAALAEVAVALAPSRERLAETLETGAAFARAVEAAAGLALPPLPYPVAVGLAARGLGLPRATVAALWLQAFAGNLVLAAVRFLPLGQAEGQGVLARLAPLILEVAAAAEAAAAAGDEGFGGAAFGADIAAMEHETMDVRIFRT